MISTERNMQIQTSTIARGLKVKQAVVITASIIAFAALQAIAPGGRCEVCCTVCCTAVTDRQTIAIQNDDQLRAALANLRTGTTLSLAPGVYRGGNRVTSVDGVTIEARDPASPPEFRDGNLAWHFSKCSQLTLRNLRIVGQRDNGVNIDDGGQLDKPVTDITLEGLQIADIGPRGNHDAIKLSGLDGFAIRNCTIHGWAGQGVDMVGCHDGVIEGCDLIGKEGYSASAGIQTKGGSSNIKIVKCSFKEAGERPINVGGSTGLAFFRPKDASYEAANITITDCRIEGSLCAVAFVGVSGANFKHNTILHPKKWIFRVLQETTGERFVPCQAITIEDNCFVFRREQVNVECNVGNGTKAETMIFKGNRWLAEDAPQSSKPRLPVSESEAQYGIPCAKAAD